MKCAFCNRKIKEGESHKTALIRTYVGKGEYEKSEKILCDGPSMDEAKQKELLPKDYGFPLFISKKSVDYFKKIRFCAEIFRALKTKNEGSSLLVGVEITS